MPEHLRLRRVASRSPVARIAILPSGPGKTVGPRIAHFEAQCPCLHMHLSTLQVRPRGRPRMTRVQDGWLFLFLATLSFATPCRFIPTLSTGLEAPKAITAMARKLACLFYRLIKHGQQYVDQGTEYYEARYREQQIRSLAKRAQKLGLQLIIPKTA